MGAARLERRIHARICGVILENGPLDSKGLQPCGVNGTPSPPRCGVAPKHAVRNRQRRLAAQLRTDRAPPREESLRARAKWDLAMDEDRGTGAEVRAAALCVGLAQRSSGRAVRRLQGRC